MSDDTESAPIRALVARPQTRRLGLARDLESARPGELVHVDRAGRVRSPARYQAIMATSYGLLGVMNVGAAWLYATWFGALTGGIVGGALFAWTGYWLHRRLRTRRALELFMANQIDEAQEIFESEIKRRFQARNNRVVLRLSLAGCYVRKGALERALQELGQGKKEAGNRKSLGLWRTMFDHGEIAVLSALGRATEARAVLNALPKLAPGADYLELGLWKAELCVAFAEGKATFSEDVLHERTRRTLAITDSSVMLALLAWAYDVSGDSERAQELAVESAERLFYPDQFDWFPALKAWLEKRVSLERPEED